LVWEENKKLIEKHNKEREKGLHGYRLGINSYSDMVWLNVLFLNANTVKPVLKGHIEKVSYKKGDLLKTAQFL
jgi:hypothetical protein